MKEASLNLSVRRIAEKPMKKELTRAHRIFKFVADRMLKKPDKYKHKIIDSILGKPVCFANVPDQIWQCWYCTDDNGKLIGSLFLSLRPTEQEAVISYVTVDSPRIPNDVLKKEMLSHIIAYLQQNHRTIKFLSHNCSAACKEFYSSLGFMEMEASYRLFKVI